MPRAGQPAPESFDPTLPQKQAAAYLGCSTRQLRRLTLERTPIPSTGTKRLAFGYRLSTLNRYRDSLSDPASRSSKVKAS
jgi:hypothetical protein